MFDMTFAISMLIGIMYVDLMRLKIGRRLVPEELRKSCNAIFERHFFVVSIGIESQKNNGHDLVNMDGFCNVGHACGFA